MFRRMIWPIVFGIGGAAILASLGMWQVQRLGWKQEVLASIDARIRDEPVAIPEDPDPDRDRYLSVAVEGTIAADHVRVLVSQRGQGAGYRVISPLDTGEATILVDRGIMPTEGEPPVHEQPLRVVGNLHWPQEVDAFTPENDLARNIWYSREVTELAGHFGTEPILIVARDLSVDDAPVEPLPVGTDDIPNDHVEYAVTWFSLAALWLGMTLYLLWRIRRKPV